MTHALTVELVTPEKLIYSAPAEMVVVPGQEGDMGVLPGHAPVMSSLRRGVVEIHNAGEIKRVFVGGGFIEVNPERCIVLAEEAVDLASLDKKAAQSKLESARKALTDAVTEPEMLRAKAAFEIAEALVDLV